MKLWVWLWMNFWKYLFFMTFHDPIVWNHDFSWPFWKTSFFMTHKSFFMTFHTRGHPVIFSHNCSVKWCKNILKIRNPQRVSQVDPETNGKLALTAGCIFFYPFIVLWLKIDWSSWFPSKIMQQMNINILFLSIIMQNLCTYINIYQRRNTITW